jgi:hypothetical protein
MVWIDSLLHASGLPHLRHARKTLNNGHSFAVRPVEFRERRAPESPDIPEPREQSSAATALNHAEKVHAFYLFAEWRALLLGFLARRALTFLPEGLFDKHIMPAPTCRRLQA